MARLQMSNDIVTVNVKSPKSAESDSIQVNLQYVAHFSDYVTCFFYETINYCKQIPEFRRLSEDDQIVLLRSAAWEMLLLQSCQYLNTNNNEFRVQDMSYNVSDLEHCGLDQTAIQRFVAFGKTLNSISLSKEELVVTFTLIIFCEDRKGLQEVNDVSQIQERYAMLLQKLMSLSTNTARRNGKNRFPEVIFMLSEARCIAFIIRPLMDALYEQCPDELPALMTEMIL